MYKDAMADHFHIQRISSTPDAMVSMRVSGVSSLDEATDAQRLAIVDALARAEREVGSATSVHITRDQEDLVLVVRATSSMQRIMTGGLDHPLITPIFEGCARAATIDLLAAFVMKSGVVTIAPRLLSALERGARLRVLTGDYLGRTHPDALHHLLDVRDEAALAVDVDGTGWPGSLEVRVVEMASLDDAISSFHPKAWIFDRNAQTGRAFVGSSNLSRAALRDGIEWNLRLDRTEDSGGFAHITRAYDDLWNRATSIDRRWIERYRERAEHAAAEELHHPSSQKEAPPTPRALQKVALDALRAHRQAGAQRALIEMATGLGKTFLAAFDAADFERDLGHPATILFVAHRAELLRQAAATYRRVFPTRRVGFVLGQREEIDADLLFGGIQKLARGERLEQLPPIDYLIIDEAHHAEASTYRELLDHLNPRFTLGLTATPERGDGVHVAHLFGGEVVFAARLAEGIEQGALVPFRYVGLKDLVDYAPIPWRSGRFDTEELTRAVHTEARMTRLWEAWRAHEGARTLVFCCSIAHADYVAAWLKKQGVRAVAVHSGEESADRAHSIDALEEGGLEAICVVDLFNEGVDIPRVDRVIMLRPTDSQVIFLQQLGRGLRTAPGKHELCVIDFVGNHRVFLDRLRALAAWTRDTPLRIDDLRDKAALTATLPPGCSIDIELEAIDLLAQLMPEVEDCAMIAAYRTWRDQHGVRPRAADLAARGVNPAAAKSFGGWFSFVHEEGDLSPIEQRTLLELHGWFQDLEKTTLSAEHLRFVQRAVAHLHHQYAEDKMPPLTLWEEAIAPKTCAALPSLHVDGGVPTVTGLTRELAQSWAGMTEELLEYLIARRRRLDTAQGAGNEEAAFEARVIHTRGRPFLKLPPRDKVDGIPRGEEPVWLDDGSVWVMRFVQIACNVAYPLGGGETNQLPGLLRRWFGQQAGQPGTTYRVRFTRSVDHWAAAPVGRPLGGFEVGEVVTPQRIADVFPIEHVPRDEDAQITGGDDAYTLCFVQSSDALLDYDALQATTMESLRSPEAHIFFAEEEGEEPRWRYHGLGHPRDDQEAWSIEEVDYSTYKRHGATPGASRRLDEDAEAWAEAFVERFERDHEPGDIIEARGKTCRFLSITSRKSIRIDGGEDGFSARSISKTDLAWVHRARERCEEALVTEEFVNQLRYLPGTPKKSTRYIDTNWALVLTEGTAHTS